MRILSMIASLAESGGAEMLVRNLSLEYARRGHQCHVVYISDATSLSASADYERAFREQLDGAGIGHTMLGHGSRRNLLLGAWRLRRAVRAFRPDVMHLHLGWGLLFQAVGLLRVPTVYTHHNIVFKFSPRLFRLFDRFVARYVAICAACETLLARHVRRPIVRIYNGVPVRFSEGQPRTSLPRDIDVLSVGNLTPQKDYPTLLDVAERLVPALAAEGRGIRFRIAGEGPERPALEREIARRGLSEHVELLGARQDVPTLMAQADVLFLCSRHEGLPIALIEAAMSALPAVATDVGGCAEIVEDRISGRLAAPGTPEDLAEAIRDVIGDVGRYVIMSHAARLRAAGFTLAACADAHLRLYAEVVERGR